MVASIAKLKLLIVGEEILSTNEIAKKLSDYNYDIIGTADSANKALEFLANNQGVDMVLIDMIPNGKLEGIELRCILNDNYRIPFIFLTSKEDNYIIDRAQNVESYTYLVKPFNKNQVCTAIELTLNNFLNTIYKNEILEEKCFKSSENLVLNINDGFFLKKDHHFERVQFVDILFFKADSNYCSIYTKSNYSNYAVALNTLEKQLPTNIFIRVHKSYVVNINAVMGFEGNFLFIQQNRIPVSELYKEAVFKLFNSI